jgi:HSP20 family protein
MLMRFDPFRELDRLANATAPRQWPAMLAMDAYRQGDRFLVHFDLPGIKSDTIELSVEQNVLTVKAERGWTRSPEDELVVSERPQGQFSRQLFLGESLDADRIQASYDDGVLTLAIPIAERAKPRKVAIKTSGNGAKAVDATSTETETESSKAGSAVA